jgi:hypothetical protein
MTLVPVMWSVWGSLVAIVAALYVYRSSLTKDEDDQLYLDAAFDHEKNAQEAIVAKVNKIEPILRVFMWLAAATSVFVVGYYILDIVNRLR